MNEPDRFALALRDDQPGGVEIRLGEHAPLERSQAEALKAALPSWQKYTGRYVLTDPNAIRTVTFSEYDVSIVNQKWVLTVPELRPGSVVYMKETPLEPFGGNVFHVAGGSFYGNFMTFESNQDGSMVLKWRNYVFKRQP